MIRQDMKFTEQKSPTASPDASSAHIINFLEARDRLLGGLEKTRGVFEIKRKVGKVAARRIPSGGRIDRLEDSLYWLFSAATLIILPSRSLAAESSFQP
jgi:hypothetical protein